VDKLLTTLASSSHVISPSTVKFWASVTAGNGSVNECKMAEGSGLTGVEVRKEPFSSEEVHLLHAQPIIHSKGLSFHTTFVAANYY